MYVYMYVLIYVFFFSSIQKIRSEGEEMLFLFMTVCKLPNKMSGL